jgi:hypothetical protein
VRKKNPITTTSNHYKSSSEQLSVATFKSLVATCKER